MSVRGAALWAMGGQYASFIIQFVSSVLISRYFLTPAEVGIFSIAMAITLFVATFQDFGLSKYLAALPVASPDEIARCSSVALLFSLAVAGIIAALAWPMSIFYGYTELFPLMLITGFSYLFLPLAIVPLALMGRRMAFQHHFVVNVGGAAAQAIISLALAAAGYSAFALAWGTLAAAIARGGLAQWLRPALPWPLKLNNLGSILSFGGKSSTLYLTGALGSRTPDLIVGKLISLAAVGLFSRAVSLSEQFRMLISGAIGSVFFPAFARIRDEGQPIGPAYLRVVAGYTAIVWPGMAALALIAEPIVRLLYGENWLGVAPLLSWVSLASLIMISLPLVSELPILMGQMNRLIVYNILDTFFSIIFLIIGAQFWGVEGAAISRVVYAIVWLIPHYHLMKQVVGFDTKALLHIYLKSGAAAIAAILPATLVFIFWQSPSQIGLLMLGATSIVGILLWLATLKFVKHPAHSEIVSFARAIPVLRRFISI